MRTWIKQLGIGLGALLTGGVAHAFPPQCMEVCACNLPCTTICYEGTTRSSCDAGWACECLLPGPSSSLGDAAAEPEDASQAVCTLDDELPSLDGGGDSSS
ncbi:MAG TPA: hypothetical protein VFK02_18015 [Kofleriaceae bacterium]|nr:hypothetical protein [Kofleriaceae bacterium]